MRYVVLIALGALAACGDGGSFDSGFKNGFREKFVSSCASGAQARAAAGVTIDFERICACTADKVMAGKTTSELMSYQPGADAEAAIAQCAAEAGLPR